VSKEKIVELGDEVKDNLSGVSGTVVAIAKYLYGCTQLNLCRKKKNQEEPKYFWVDEPQVTIIKKQVQPKPVVKNHGPQRTPPPKHP